MHNIFTYTLHEGTITQEDRERKAIELSSLIKTHGDLQIIKQFEKR